MELSAGPDHLEVEPLKLTAEHFPLPCSLLKPVLDRYADLQVSAADESAMAESELLDYIRKTEGSDLPTLEAALVQADAIGDPALPNMQQVCILRWLQAALEDWESRFGLEEPLAGMLQPLKPVVAGMAVTDPDFLTPGAHPVHQILDTIQDGAIGWQPRLGRAGQALERQVGRVVERVLAWFDDRDVDLGAICADLRTAVERDRTRSHRMTQRVIETEQGRVKTAEARLEAARMINAALEQYPAPSGIGQFLKDHWYASAQLVLLKYGADSEEWRSMSDTTTALLDSLQSREDESEEQRQQLLERVTRVPKDLKRWLLNLHHDSEAVADTVALIEFAHLRVMRKQPLVLEKIAPIVLEDEEVADVPGENPEDSAADDLEPGQWFRIGTPDGDLRVYLALKLEQDRQLLFTNQAGIKVLQQDFDEFTRAVYRGQVVALEGGASFSACLAAAAGIRSVEDLEAFTGAAAEQARQQEQARLEQERLEGERLERERQERERLEAERQEAEHLERERQERERLEEAERLERERKERERLEEAERLERERKEGERQERERQERERLETERLELERARLEAEQRERERGLAEQQAQASNQADEQARIDEYLRQKEERQERDSPAPDAAGAAGGDAEEVAVNLPMGAWLGFHDGDTPLLAKLAVHDREQDQYFFVNREGVKMRQLSKRELLSLMDRGLVDILESRSNFRDEVTRIRGQLEE